MKENREAPKEVKIRLTEEQHAALLRRKKKTGNAIAVIVRNYIIAGLETEDQKGAGRKAAER
jgi:predicted DNA-binding protein